MRAQTAISTEQYLAWLRAMRMSDRDYRVLAQQITAGSEGARFAVLAWARRHGLA